MTRTAWAEKGMSCYSAVSAADAQAAAAESDAAAIDRGKIEDIQRQITEAQTGGAAEEESTARMAMATYLRGIGRDADAHEEIIRAGALAIVAGWRAAGECGEISTTPADVESVEADLGRPLTDEEDRDLGRLVRDLSTE